MAESVLNPLRTDEQPSRRGRIKRLLQWLVDHREQILALLAALGVKVPPLPPRKSEEVDGVRPSA